MLWQGVTCTAVYAVFCGWVLAEQNHLTVVEQISHVYCRILISSFLHVQSFCEFDIVLSRQWLSCEFYYVSWLSAPSENESFPQANCSQTSCKESPKMSSLGGRLRLVFTSDGVVVGVIRELTCMTQWKSKIGVVSGVISSTESESEESECFHFFRFCLRLRRLWSSEN